MNYSSMKRASISFTIPGEGRVTFQENAGATDRALRKCIVTARRAFFKAYEKQRQVAGRATTSTGEDEKASS